MRKSAWKARSHRSHLAPKDTRTRAAIAKRYVTRVRRGPTGPTSPAPHTHTYKHGYILVLCMTRPGSKNVPQSTVLVCRLHLSPPWRLPIPTAADLAACRSSSHGSRLPCRSREARKPRTADTPGRIPVRETAAEGPPSVPRKGPLPCRGMIPFRISVDAHKSECITDTERGRDSQKGAVIHRKGP